MDCGFEEGEEGGVGDGVGEVDFVAAGWGGFTDVVYGFLAGAVDGGEVDYDIAGLVDEVVEDGVETGCGVGDEYDGRGWCVDVLCHCCSGLI